MTTRENIELLRAQVHYYIAEGVRAEDSAGRAYAEAMAQDLAREVAELELSIADSPGRR
jgi:hypothetical protein